jgi:chaperonin cofactor prefoldin
VTTRERQLLSDLRRRTEELERRSDDLERRSDELGRKTEEVRQDWRRKRADSNVPGAAPEGRGERGADSPEGRDRGS